MNVLRALSFAGLFVFGSALGAAAEIPVITPAPTAGVARTGAALGFVVHPREAYYEQLNYCPASAELTNILHWNVVAPTPTTPEQIQADFPMSVNWFRKLYASGRRAYPILETGVHNSGGAPWLTAMVGNERLVAGDGTVRDYGSHFSPIFRQAVFAYIDQLIDWIKLNDREHRIPGYTNGAEWFWPGTMDYSPLAMQAWREWLKARYGSLAALNDAWGAQLASWDAAEPPRTNGMGSPVVGGRTYSLDGSSYDLAWATAPVAIAAGTTVTASVSLATAGVPEGLAVIQVAWFKNGGVLKTEDFALDDPAAHALSGQAVAPAGADAVQLLCKLLGPGTAVFTAPVLRNAQGQSLIPTELGAWYFAQWAGSGQSSSSLSAGKPRFEITAAAPTMPYGRSGVALEDWTVFSYEAMAGWLNDSAAHIKQRDPSRTVGSYVGFVFGTHSMWDLAYEEQRLDISLANSPAIDVNGIQLCVAGEDFTYATAPLDIARKYNKPLRATDLVDFPWGLYSGLTPIYRGALAGVQHGLDEIFFYNWHGTPDYSFFALLTAPQREKLLGGLQAAIAALRDCHATVEVAQLMPIMSYSLADEGGAKGDPLDNGGLYHLLLDAGLMPDAWTPYEIEKQGAAALARYRAIILPDCPVLPPAANAALVSYVEQGGVIVGAGRAPAKDLGGRALPRLLVEREVPLYQGTIGKGKVIWSSTAIGRPYWGKVRRRNFYGNTPPVFIEEPDAARTPQARRALREQLIERLTLGGVTPATRLDLATEGINVATYQHPLTAERRLFLVRHGGAAAQASGVTLTVADSARISAAAVRVDLSETSQPLTVQPGGTLVLPPFSDCCLVTLTPLTSAVRHAAAWSGAAEG